MIAFLLTRPSRDVTVVAVNVSFFLSFLLTRPSRDVTVLNGNTYKVIEISTHTSLAGRDYHASVHHIFIHISTHTSLAGRDQFPLRPSPVPAYFYSHVPRGT